jgi:hypothetical protein
MSLGHGWEKLHLALNFVASSELPLQERLAIALAQDLSLILECDVPPAVWERLEAMRAKVTTSPMNGLHMPEEAVTARLSTLDAERCLQEIVLLYDEVCREYAKLECRRG